MSISGITFHGTSGTVLPSEGLEAVVYHDGTTFHMWYHGAYSDYEKTAYGNELYNLWQLNGGVIRYRSSTDGDTWTDSVIVIDRPATGTGCALPFVCYDGGYYHMLVSIPEQHGWDYYRSDTPDSGWTLVKTAVLGFGDPDGSWQYTKTPSGDAWDNYRTGNICFWREGSTWQGMYEAMDSATYAWQPGRFSAPDLEHITKYAGNPVLSAGAGKALGGPDVHKVGSTYYAFFHRTIAEATTNIPTEIVAYTSTDLDTWTFVDDLFHVSHAGYGETSQDADASVVEVDGVTHIFWEYLYEQHDCPDICYATFAGTIAEMLAPGAEVILADYRSSSVWHGSDVKFRVSGAQHDCGIKFRSGGEWT